MTEKPTKKTKGGQKLTWHHIIIRDVKTIEIDTKKAIKLSKNRDTYKTEVVDHIMSKALNNYFPEDGDLTLPGRKLAKARKRTDDDIKS